MSRYNYGVTRVRHMSDREVREAYTRLRAVAQKRVNRLQAAGYGDYDITRSGMLPKQRGADVEDVRGWLIEVNIFLNDSRSRVGKLLEQENKIKSTLSEHGYEIENLKSFGEFMEFYRNKLGDIAGTSDLIAEIFNESERIGISAKTLERKYAKYMRNQENTEKLLDLMVKSEGRGIKSRELEKVFGNASDSKSKRSRGKKSSGRG